LRCGALEAGNKSENKKAGALLYLPVTRSIVQAKSNHKGKNMAQEVRAPLAGGIWQVLVEVGSKVEEDDELLIIEALKMENTVYSPCAGTVKEIKVKKGDAVEDDAVLMIIE